jgi:hypothetical protein
MARIAPMPGLALSGQHRRQLHEALLDAFPSRAALAQMVSFQLERRLAEISDADNLTDIVFRLIEHCEAAGAIDSLFHAALRERPSNPALAALAPLFSAPPPPGTPMTIPAPAERGSLGRGLQALAGLMQDAAVRAAVAEFRSDFAAAAEQVELLGAYKDVHDLLHTLQFQCYRGIAQEARRFPDDETAREILLDHQLTLQGLVEHLVELTGAPRFPPADATWVRGLSDAAQELARALDTRDPTGLKRVVWQLDRVLSVQPAHINTRLNAAARALRLPSLVEAMTTIRAQLDGQDLDAARIQQFGTAVGTITALSEEVQVLVGDHDRLQALDLELRRIRAGLRDDMEELRLSWPQVKDLTAAFETRTEEWTVALTREGRLLDQVLVSDDASRIRQGFQRYYSVASDRFYRVDLALKRVCEDLRSAGEPLAFVLDILE